MATIPSNLSKILEKFGADLAAARKRRRMSTAAMAARVQVSRPTLKRIERGDPSVAIGSYAVALEVFGLVDRLADLASARHDEEGLALETKRLPKRIGKRKKMNHGYA